MSTEPTDSPTEHPSSPLPRPLVLVSVALAGLLVVGVAILGVLYGSRGDEQPTGSGVNRTGPLAMPPVPAPAAGSTDCAALLKALPATLTSGNQTLTRRELIAPAPEGAVAWGNPNHDPVVLRCGLERPAELTPTAQLYTVSGVDWLQIPGGFSNSWLAVDRPAYVALTVPSDAGTGPIQDISAALTRSLPKKPVDARPLSTEPTPTH